MISGRRSASLCIAASAVGLTLAAGITAGTGGAGVRRNGLIAFASDRSGVFQLYVMRLDGSGVRRLSPGGDHSPSWSPDGKRIAFAEGGAIYVMNADGSHRRNLTPSDVGDATPAWSPNGRQIAFATITAMDNGTYPPNRDIAVMNADGSHVVDLTEGGFEDNTGPTWSPDGREIAYSGDEDVYIIRAGDGSAVRMLAYGSAPAWSPDGKEIACANGGIEIINSDGSHRRHLTHTSDTHPAWSLDGRSIAFVHRKRNGSDEIYVMKANGSGQRALTKTHADNEDPAWSAG